MKIYPNNKPWINKELISMLNDKRKIRHVGSEAQKREFQKQIDRKIKDFKNSYKENVEGRFKTNKFKDAWKGLKTLCGFKKKQTTPGPEDVVTFMLMN